MPKANAKNFEEENLRMGVGSVLDLLMGESKDKQDLAKTKLDGGFIDYSHQQSGVGSSAGGEKKGSGEPKKKEKVDRYLTI